jgi:hypothetical protein
MTRDVCVSAALGVEIPDLTAGGGDCDGDGSMGMDVGGEECCRVVAIDGAGGAARNVFTSTQLMEMAPGAGAAWAVRVNPSSNQMLFSKALLSVLHNRQFSGK